MCARFECSGVDMFVVKGSVSGHGLLRVLVRGGSACIYIVSSFIPLAAELWHDNISTDKTTNAVT